LPRNVIARVRKNNVRFFSLSTPRARRRRGTPLRAFFQGSVSPRSGRAELGTPRRGTTRFESRVCRQKRALVNTRALPPPPPPLARLSPPRAPAASLCAPAQGGASDERPGQAPSARRRERQSAPPAAKRPGGGGGGGAPAPHFLDDGDEDDEDVFLDDALDADVAAQEGGAAGVRASWRRPAPPPLDPAHCAIGTCGVRACMRACAAPRAPRRADPACASPRVSLACVCVCAFGAAEFQQMDIDHVIGAPHADWMPGAPPQAAIIRMFGVTAAGARARCAEARTRRAAARPKRCCFCLRCLTHAAFALFAVSAPQAAACAATSTASSPTSSPPCRPRSRPMTWRRSEKPSTCVRAC
jgi:hypothetical protein